MAVGHITFDRNSVDGAMLANALAHLEQGIDGLQRTRDMMIQMKNGAVFDSYAVGKFGTTDVPGMTALFAEIDSALAKLNDPATAAALKQLQDKLR
jgi:hypothetical protein